VTRRQGSDTLRPMYPRHILSLVVFSLACGGEPPPLVMPPLHVTGKPPAAERARWVFAGPAEELRAKLDLGDGRTLYVGEHGRRELGKAGELTHATTLALESLAGVVRDGKRFVFVAADGDVYTSTEPLGTLERASHPRSEADALTSVTTGHAAFLGIAHNGTLMRSSDFGATWHAVDYSRTKLIGGAAEVALDSKGNGVLVHLPQRLFVTHDDGASWTPLVSPQNGAVSATRDGADRIFVTGYQQRAAVLEGDTLVATKDRPSPVYAAASSIKPEGEPPESRLLLTGDHVVEVSLHDHGTEKSSVELRSARIGEPLPQDWASHPELVPTGRWNQTMLQRIAESNGELVYLRTTDPNDDAATEEVKPLTTTVLHSKDYGVTWQKAEVLQGTLSEEAHEGVDVAIGPRGWMYVGPLCPSQYSHDCKPATVRPAGKHAFEAIVGDPFVPVRFFFDEPRNKVYILAAHDRRQVVYELPLDGSKLSRTDVLNAPPFTNVAVTVDAIGTLRAFERTDRRYWTVTRRNAKGEMQQPVFVPFGNATLALVGPRGLSLDDHDAWETNDGGDTWTRVPSNGLTSTLLCAEAGCLLDDAARVGWELPAFASTDVMRAQTTVPDDKTHVETPTPPAVTPIKVSCKVSGAGTALAAIDWMDGSTGVARWAQLDTNFTQGAVTLVWGSKDAFHRVPLMPAAPKPSRGDATQVRTAQAERDNGMIAARYRFAARTAIGYSPVNVEIAWWSALTGQVHHGVLPQVKPFRVSRFQLSGMARIVDGGLVFRGDDSDVIHFIHDDGKDETLTSPAIAFDEVWHSGKRWVVADSSSAVVALADSEDGGKTWMQRSWGFARALPNSLPPDGTLER
jgi:photosystem II stability/assembly factor-like uncharacterized protein